MKEFTKEEYMADDKTHRYWWSWIAAHPPTTSDKWYPILRQIFADNTTNCLTGSRWSGFYTERQENHQTVGMFHSFSALPTLCWAERLLRACRIDFKPPISDVRWQYQLQGSGGGLHADIALGISDANGPSSVAIVFEAKKKGGKLNAKDIDGSYTRLPQLEHFAQKEVVLLVDEADLRKIPESCSLITWQNLAKIQIEEFILLNLPVELKNSFVDLMQAHLGWYLFAAPSKIHEAALIKPIAESSLECLDAPLSALIRGAEIVVRARARLPIAVPPMWENEHSIEFFREKKLMKGWDKYFLQE